MTQFQRCFVFVLIAVVLALSLRVPKLQMRPMHTDEAVHAMKFGQLLEQNSYTYNPQEYHGPTLNFLTLIPAWLSSQHEISEVNEFTLRIVPVISGVLLIILMLLLFDGLGPMAVGFAAVLIAVSPAFVFYSRYYIQEMLLACFTFGIIACGYRYLKSQHLIWALLTGLFIGLAHATKETCIIVFSAIIFSFILVLLFHRKSLFPLETINKKKIYFHGFCCLITGLLISVLFYSSFFTNPQGILDSFTTYASYFHKASTGHTHIHPWYYYLKMLTRFQVDVGPVWSEAFVIILALFGFLYLFSKKYMRPFDVLLVRFIALYTLIMTLIYAAIPYKTPWLMLGFYHGMILMAAVGMVIFNKMAINVWRKVFIRVTISIGIIFLCFQSYIANFHVYTDPIYPYAYAHTSIDVFTITDKIKKAAASHPEKQNIYIQIIFPNHNYWPLPWYLRDFKYVAYQNKVDPELYPAPLIISSPELESELVKKLYDYPSPGNKDLYMPFFLERLQLRPGVPVIGFIEKDLNESVQEHSP